MEQFIEFLGSVNAKLITYPNPISNIFNLVQVNLYIFIEILIIQYVRFQKDCVYD